MRLYRNLRMLFHYRGPDIYRIRQAINELISGQSPEGLSVSRFDLSQNGQMDELEREIKYPSFFQNLRILIANNALSNAETAEQTLKILERYQLPKEPSLMLIVVSSNDGRPSSALKKIQNYLDRHAKTLDFKDLNAQERSRWIEEFCSERGKSIGPVAIKLITNRVLTETWALAMELEKLCAYAKEKEITPTDIEILVPQTMEQDEFELSNALYAHNKRGALSAMWRALTKGAAEQLVLGTVISAVRSMILVQGLLKQTSDIGIISKTIGLHPFVAQKALRGARSYDKEHLLDVHAQLARLDRAAKDGKMDILDGLTAILLRS